MRTFSKVFGSAAIATALLLVPMLSGAESLGAMRVRLVQGDVQVKIADTGEWAPASANMPLVEGDELWIPDDGRAELQTNNGTFIRPGPNTALLVLRVDRDSFQFHLPQGQVYVLSRAPRQSVLQFDTPDGSIRAFGNSTFRIDIPDGETDVSVLKGSVLAENDAGTTRVEAGDMLVFAADGYAELSPLPPPDEWQAWNARRDRIVLARREGSRYLPAELRVYASDFNDGRWVYVQDYGYCWTPTVTVIQDWAPYRHGRWVWRGGDYVWVGYEPWGWAPYHYGRWAFVVRIGWCWVPPARGDVYWAPGYVGWVRTGDHVAWVPLAPREVYYGHGHYGRHSVDLRKVNVTQVRVANVYRNVNVTNSITIVNQTTFVTGRPAPVDRGVVARIRDNFAQRRDVVVGRPPIQPAGSSYHPVVRQIPESKRPPAAVRKIDAKELRKSRPLVREPNRSAVQPQAKPRALEVRKVDKPRSPRERAGERQQIRPAEPRGPRAPQGRPPAEVEREGKPAPAVPGTPAPDRIERKGGRPQAPPAETVQPGARPVAPRLREDRGRSPAEAVPAERTRRQAPAGSPQERREVAPQAAPTTTVAPQGRPAGPRTREERGGTPPQAAPQERMRRQAPASSPPERVERRDAQPPASPPKVTPEAPRGGAERAAEKDRPPAGSEEKTSPEPARKQGKDQAAEREGKRGGKRQRVAPKGGSAAEQPEVDADGNPIRGKRVRP